MTGRANRRRGEIEAVLDGERRILCLTLGALAELETAFAIDSLNELAARFSRGAIGAHDIIRIVGAGLRGGGNLMSDEEVAAMTAEGGIQGFARIVAELLSVTFAPAGSEHGSRAGGSTGGGAAARGDVENPPLPHPGAN